MKIAYTDGGADAGAENRTVEIPYQAKQVALDLLTAKMYEDTMTLNIKALSGGSLTNVAINVAKTDFDLKIDLFEFQAIDVVNNILNLLGVTGASPKFKRRTLTNDTETVNNISAMMSDGYVDVQWCIENNPLISDDEQAELLQRVELARTGIPQDDVPDIPVIEVASDVG